AEDKRFCSSCGAPVGRGVAGKPGRTEGFCAKCRSPFSFAAKLKPGELVAGQYEVAGALAHGGMGWIYLARDKNVSNRWVVLKGLLNTGDPDALAAAIAEQQFLARVEHPLIVEIYNFVTHEGAGYIVMEYVGGKSLKQILKDRMAANGGTYDPLPVDQALAYIYEILPAFAYLHDLGLVYCDFKPDNLIQIGDALKLIDLGGVRRIDDQDSAIYGTVGYQAPEVAEHGVSVASDIYTIGRTLLVLCMEFRGYQGTYLHSLPPVDQTPLFQEHDSLHWLIEKCCAKDPADRFASIDELRTQLLGVLREVVALRTPGTALTSASSALFHSPVVAGDVLDWATLPTLREDPTDPQHSWLASLADSTVKDRLNDLDKAPADSPEVLINKAMARLQLGHVDKASQLAQQLLTDDPWEWRALWLQGLGDLQRSDFAQAQESFNAVYRQIPGELAPKLALALACELGGRGEVAEGLYMTCAQTDATYVAPAAFGIARVRAHRGDTKGAVEALEMVPSTARGYPQSRRLRATVLLEGHHGNVAVLDQAMHSLDTVSMAPAERATLIQRILSTALPLVKANPPKRGTMIGTYPATESGLRTGIEDSYRILARESTDPNERIRLVNQANAQRNWSLT
ncbi:MAG TPA: tetratricopeptide repeat protein, partial [Marmoricola sp.]|nr:tetratricopeptide repeat protein [Marmoricola sp.]